jgi:hypothetical protein
MMKLPLISMAVSSYSPPKARRKPRLFLFWVGGIGREAEHPLKPMLTDAKFATTPLGLTGPNEHVCYSLGFLV